MIKSKGAVWLAEVGSVGIAIWLIDDWRIFVGMAFFWFAGNIRSEYEQRQQGDQQ